MFNSLHSHGLEKSRPVRIEAVQCFVSGALVPPVARLKLVRVRRHEGEWKEDGHQVSAHVDPDIKRLAGYFAAEDMALVLYAVDGFAYRTVA
jgi:hypothetical protein